MKRLLLAVALVMVLVGAFGCEPLLPIAPAPTVAPTAVSGPVSFTIFHTNDVHAHITPSKDKDIGGYARMAALVSAARSKGGPVLLLDAGDALQGTPFWTAFEGQATVEIMNAMRYDAFTLGNHEFDKGQALLAQRLGEMNCPVLCANLEYDADSPMRASKVRPYVILNVGGLRVGILGLTTEETPAISMGAFQGVKALSAIEMARKLVAEMQPQTDLIIALTHIGVDEDEELVSQVDGVDLVIGGHSHTVLLRPAEGTSPSGQQVLVAQTGAYSRYIGQIDLTVDPKAKPRITAVSGQLIELTNSIADDPQIKTIVDKWQAQLPPIIPVGETQVDLDFLTRNSESNAGDLFCDAMLDYFVGGSNPGWRPTIAVYNSGGLRGGRIVPAGPITTDDIGTWEPFGNTIVIMDLTAPQLKEVLESEARTGVMQVGGLTYQIDNTKPAQVVDDQAKKVVTPGQRIVRITIEGKDIDLTDATKVYRVATNNFLTGGGDGCYTLLEGKNAVNTEVVMTDALETYIRKHSPIAPEVEGRITFGSR